MSDTHTFVVMAERQDKPGLVRRLDDLTAVAADLANNPRQAEAEALMHMAADVLLTLRMDAAEKELAVRMYMIG